MKHIINRVAIIFSVEGEPTVEVYSNRRLLGRVDFVANPPERVILPDEPMEPFEIYFPATMRDLVINLFRAPRVEVIFDREARTLRFDQLGH